MLEIHSRIGKYEIVKLLGAGGMGEVYAARDTELDREVALKSIPAQGAGDPSRRSRFLHALELDDTLAEGHAALAWIKFNYDWDCTRSGGRSGAAFIFFFLLRRSGFPISIHMAIASRIGSIVICSAPIG